MNATRKNEIVTGIFFIAATVCAIIGIKLYDPVLIASDYLIVGVKNSNQIVLGAVFELILACSAVGTAIMLFPFLKRYSESWGLGYVCFRLLEAVFIIIGILSMLTIVTLSEEYFSHAGSNIAYFQASAKLLKAVHDWTFVLGPHFLLGINTFIYSFIFFQSKLVPRKMSIVGLIGAVLIFTASLLEMYGIISYFSTQTLIMALPIATYEMVLAFWLILKGFTIQAPN